MQLRIMHGADANTIIQLNTSSFTIGREGDNDYIIQKPEVSRHHCRLSKIDSDWIIEDCKSVNGILVNNRRVDGGMTLQPGDRITVFSVVFRFEPSQTEEIQQPSMDAAITSRIPPLAAPVSDEQETSQQELLS